MLKRAIMVGCNAAGVNVGDLEVATIPVTRHQVRNSGSRGGVTVRLAENDPQSVVIRFFDADGLDIDEGAQRKIERLYHREEFRRVLAQDIGDIDFPPRAVEQYTADLVAAVDLSVARAAGLKLVLDLSYGSASFVMPNLLAKLDADVLVVNPYAQTPGMMAVDSAVNAARVAELVRASGAQLGAVVDADGERLTIVDDEGTVLSDQQALLVLLRLVTDTEPHARISLPVGVSSAAERICEEAGARVTFTKRSSAHLMEVAASQGISFGASQNGGFLWPDFLPAYDAAATLAKLVSLLATTDQSLSALVHSLPPVHIAHETVPTTFQQTGLIMRTLVERLGDRELLLVDGVKVADGDGWVLVVPDLEEPLVHVWAEGTSDEGARARAHQYADRLTQPPH
jgi:mannose-1-phosphate guanylyltransferase/phosphomannomutase